MNIFEELDRILLNSVKINESKSADYDSLEVNPKYSTAEQAIAIIRDKFAKKYLDSGAKPPKGPKPPTGGDPEFEEMDDTSLPNPFDDEDGGMEGKDHTVKDSELLWDEDDYSKIKEDEAHDFEEGDDEDEEDDFDTFDEEKRGGSGGGKSEEDEDEESGEDGESSDEKSGKGKSGKGPDGDGIEGEGEGEGEDESGEGKSGKGKSGEGPDGDGIDGEGEGEPGEGKSEKGKSGEGKEGEGKEGEGEPGGDGESKEGKSSKSSRERGGGSKDEKSKPKDVDKTIEDVLDRMKKSDSTSHDLKSRIEKLSDELKKDDGKSMEEKVSETTDTYREDSERPGELVGKTEGRMSDEALAKELRDHGFSEEDIEANKEVKNRDVSIPDDKLDKIRDEAIKQLEDKCKGHSKLARSILYHSLKNAKIDYEDWRKILEKILKEKSRSKGGYDSKKRRSAWGNKNHLWRGAVLPKVSYEKGGDTYKLYCFIDWSGSVSSRPGLIQSFLAKVVMLTDELIYSDVDVYGFGDILSLPRTISHKDVEENGIETVLSETYEFINSQELGGSIENFREVADEILRVKNKDVKAVFLIFGDGIWTFYGNDEPPIRLKEICPQYLDDIIAFCFYDKRNRENKDYWEYMLKEFSCLRDYVGLKDNVIIAQTEDMDEKRW